MLDFNNRQSRIVRIDREDRAMLRSNLSARSMPEDGQEHVLCHMLLPSRSSFGCNAINLLNWCEAPTKVKQAKSSPPVGHMSVFNDRYDLLGNIGTLPAKSDEQSIYESQQIRKG